MTNARPEEVGTGAVVIEPGRHDHGTAPQGQNAAALLRRRRLAAMRCEPMPDGRRDPWSCRQQERAENLDAWARALAHLEQVGLTGLAPAHVRRALASQRSAA